MEKKESVLVAQVIPLILTVAIFLFFSSLLYLQILALNHFTAVDIFKHIRLTDVLIGMIIYLKTSVDFAIFIGNLMAKFPGWKNRIAIETGTAAGNALGTLMILIIWNAFRNVEWLLALMVIIASLVLFRLAEDGLEHTREGEKRLPSWFSLAVGYFGKSLHAINQVTGRFLGFIIPNTKMNTGTSKLTFWGLFTFALTIPFILGLDDFAGYVPLFNVVNVFGFAVGVFAGHMILNIFLFLSPQKTITAVKNPYISFAGSVAFVLLGIWGFVEVFRLL